jgi:hypothetical protein
MELPTDDDSESHNNKSSLWWGRNPLSALFGGETVQAKQFLKSDNHARATTKKTFLSDQRTSMITTEETQGILQHSFRYIVALMEFNLVIFEFQQFKEDFCSSFVAKVTDADWNNLCKQDQGLKSRLTTLDDQIKSLSQSLHEVERMNMRF